MVETRSPVPTRELSVHAYLTCAKVCTGWAGRDLLVLLTDPQTTRYVERTGWARPALDSTPQLRWQRETTKALSE